MYIDISISGSGNIIGKLYADYKSMGAREFSKVNQNEENPIMAALKTEILSPYTMQISVRSFVDVLDEIASAMKQTSNLYGCLEIEVRYYSIKKGVCGGLKYNKGQLTESYIAELEMVYEGIEDFVCSLLIANSSEKIIFNNRIFSERLSIKNEEINGQKYIVEQNIIHWNDHNSSVLNVEYTPFSEGPKSFDSILGNYSLSDISWMNADKTRECTLEEVFSSEPLIIHHNLLNFEQALIFSQ